MANGADASLTELPATLPASLQHLEPVAMIGYGAYAQVLEVLDTRSAAEDRYALKVVEKQPLAARRMLQQLAREFGVQRGVKHPNIVRAVDLTEDTTHAYLLLELCVGGSVWQATQQFPNAVVPETIAARWLCDAARGVAHLHELGLVHRDVKLENMLLDGEGVVRLCDFGWCAFEVDRPQGMCGTPQLAPPEVSAGDFQTGKIDAWAIGACLVQLLTGQPLNGPHDAWLDTSHSLEAQDLTSGLLQHDPQLRLDVASALQQPFLATALAAQGAQTASEPLSVYSAAPVYSAPPTMPDESMAVYAAPPPVHAADSLEQAVLASQFQVEASLAEKVSTEAAERNWNERVAQAVLAHKAIQKHREDVRTHAREAVELAVLAIKTCQRASAPAQMPVSLMRNEPTGRCRFTKMLAESGRRGGNDWPPGEPVAAG